MTTPRSRNFAPAPGLLSRAARALAVWLVLFPLGVLAFFTDAAATNLDAAAHALVALLSGDEDLRVRREIIHRLIRYGEMEGIRSKEWDWIPLAEYLSERHLTEDGVEALENIATHLDHRTESVGGAVRSAVWRIARAARRRLDRGSKEAG